MTIYQEEMHRKAYRYPETPVSVGVVHSGIPCCFRQGEYSFLSERLTA